jgi:hypothetical protein
MKIPSPRLVALDQFDRHVPHLQLAAAALRDQMPVAARYAHGIHREEAQETLASMRTCRRGLTDVDRPGNCPRQAIRGG